MFVLLWAKIWVASLSALPVWQKTIIVIIFFLIGPGAY